jgi:hypothetical protein
MHPREDTTKANDGNITEYHNIYVVDISQIPTIHIVMLTMINVVGNCTSHHFCWFLLMLSIVHR